MNNYPCEWVKKIWTGGGDDDNLLIVNATITDNQTVTGIDKTFDEIVDFALQGGVVVMRLASNPTGTPYGSIFYLKLDYVQSDYSPSVGGGSLNFYSINASVSDHAEISLDVYTATMQTNGNVTLKYAHKLLS